MQSRAVAGGYGKLEELDMNFFRTIRILALLVTLIGPQAADATTIGQLLDHCESNSPAEAGICVGMMMGVSDMMHANCGVHLKGTADLSPLSADVQGVTYEAMIQAFRNWARDNPQSWNDYAWVGVVVTLRELFPCQ